MALVRLIFVLIVLTLPVSASRASDDLRAFLLSTTDTKNFPYHLLHENFHAIFNSGGVSLTVDKSELRELYDAQNKVLTREIEITNFKILARFDSELFTSATYEYDWSAGLGNTSMNGKVVIHAIVGKSADGWRLIFEAVTQ